MLIAAGGDDTVNRLARLTHNTNTTLGIMPCGFTNSIARSLGMEPSVEQALPIITSGHTSCLDTFLADGMMFLGSISYGLHSLAPTLSPVINIPGLRALGYPYRAVRAIKDFVPVPIRVIVDGIAYRCTPLMLTISNGEVAGSGLRAAPGAALTDGKLTVCVAEGCPKRFLKRCLPELITGQHATAEGITVLRGTSVTMESETPLSLTIDGSAYTGRRVEACIFPGSLRATVPYIPDTQHI